LKLRILQRISAALEGLQPILSTLTVSKGTTAMANGNGGDGATATTAILQTMLAYMRLPLLAILKVIAVGSWDDESIENQGEKNSISVMVVQSAMWKCVQRASCVFRATLAYAPRQSGDNLAGPRQMEEYLAAFVLALPSCRTIQTRQRTMVGRLDTGDECISSLLVTLQCLLKPIARAGPDSDEPGMPAAAELDWFYLLVDSIVALVEPPLDENDSSTTRNTAELLQPDSTTASVSQRQPQREPSTPLQQVALETLLMLFEAVPAAEPWRRVFPGVYFGLYRRILISIRVSLAHPSIQRVLIHCVASLAGLLSTSLRRIHAATGVAQELGTSAVEQQLRALATPEILSDRAVAATNAELTVEGVFLSKIQQRIPLTLSILVGMLSSAQAVQIREQAVALNRILLLDTRQCWSDDLIATCSESSLILVSDSCSAIASEAGRLVLEFSTLSESYVDSVVVNRVVDLIERLSLLVQSSCSQIELQNSLKLITGYLTLFSSKDALKSLRKSLCTEYVTASLQRSLTIILDVQLESMDTLRSNSLVLMSATQDGIIPSFAPRLRYLKEETQRNARDMILALGRVLGHKQVTIFIDGCVADLYKSCVERINRRESLEGQNHVAWLHERMGTPQLAQWLIQGGFQAEVTRDGSANKNSKRERSRLGYLLPLGKSILPIITSDPLWSLPTRARSDAQSNEPARVCATQGTIEYTALTALRGNAIVIGYLLGLIQTVVSLLGDHVQRFTPILLYPILEKASAQNVGFVRDAAIATLQTLASASGLSGIASLLAQSMETCLMGSMLAKIRVPGGRTLTPETALDHNLLQVADSAITVFRFIREEILSAGLSVVQDHSSILVSIEGLTMELTSRFDHASTRIGNGTEVAVQFLQLFHATVVLLRALRECSTSSPGNVANDQSCEPWFDLLEPFKNTSDKQDIHTPREGFAGFRADEQQRAALDGDPGMKSLAGLKRDVDFIAHLAWRCGYLLSHISLQVQIESCIVLTNCFLFLGWVASSAPRHEANGPATAVLRQVHSSWQAIEARIKATCSAVTIPSKTSLIVVSQLPKESHASNIGEQRLYLSKLLELVSAMTECCDDFMASRFREIVWPCLRTILQSSASKRHKRVDLAEQFNVIVPFYDSDRRIVDSRSASERSLLLAALHCLSRVFGHRPVGVVLSGLIPTIGTAVFPFLDDEHDGVVTSCVDSIQNMIRIDCDALWRPIHEMAGKLFPVCPLLPLQAVPLVQGPKNPLPKPSKRALTASKLLSFLRALPEQRIDG
jgi:hypothetical protein